MKKPISKLGQLIAESRESKGLSQRQLAKLAEMDSAEVSRIEAGKRQKPNVLFLRGIAEALDLSLVTLMELAGYNEVEMNWGRNREENRSMEDLRNKLAEYEQSELDLLDDSFKKRDNVRKQREKLGKLKTMYESPKMYPDVDFNIDYIMKVIYEVSEDLIPSQEKYDYSKLPKKF